MQTDDRQLLLEMHKGREAAARRLWESHAPRMLAYARAIVRPRDAAEDVVQAVFCSILSQPRERIAGVEDTAAWLAQLVRRTALNFIRSSRRARAREAGTAGPGRGQLTHSLTPPRYDPALAAALDALPRRQREVIVLRHFSGLTFDQISLALGLNRSTAASRYKAGLDALRARLNDSPGAARANGAARPTGTRVQYA